VTRYSFSRFICWLCRATLQLYIHKDKYGTGLRAYLLYQIIELQILKTRSQEHQTTLRFAKLSGFDQSTESNGGRPFDQTSGDPRTCSRGKAVHADETKIEIDGNDRYVWVFTNMEDVAFVYSETH
jgi:hypothetical protein